MTTSAQWTPLVRWLSGITLSLTLATASAATSLPPVPVDLPTTPAAEGGQVILWRIVPADFHNPSFSVESFKAIVAGSLPRSVQVQPRDTLSTLVQRHFNASRSWTPAVYTALVEQIKQANDLLKDSDLQVGSLVVPDLPRASASKPSDDNLLNAYAKISTLDRGAAAWDFDKGALIGTPVVSALGRAGSQAVIQIRELPLIAAQMRAAPTHEPALEALGYAGVGFPFDAEIAAEPAPAPQAGDCPALDPALAKILASNPRNKATVVVLDDAWPDDEEFIKARDFVVNASKMIRERFNLNGGKPTLGDVDMLAKRTETSFPAGIQPYPAITTHASAIKASLRSFTCHEKGKGVNVVFIPMGTGQSGAYPLLREILYLANLARIKSNNLTGQPMSGPTLPDQIQRAQRFAGAAFSDQKGQIQPFLNPFKPNGPNSIRTDQALIEQLAFFLRLYSDASLTPHFLSMSWTSRELAWQIFFPEYSYGLMLAAAGNSPAVDVHLKRVQFAYRSTNPGDVIAVENSDATKYLCSSSRFSQLPGVDVLGVGYPGEIADTKLCGTSFSTPRVAWLLAAREAYIATPPTDDDARSVWQIQQKSRIKGLRSLALQDSMRFNVTWQKLVGAPAD